MGEWRALKALAKEVGAINKANGWREDWQLSPTKVLSMLMLIVTEVAEAAEEVRKPDAWVRTTFTMQGPARAALAEELADVLIRVMDMADALGLDMDEAVTAKLAKNRTRGYRHGGKVA